MVTDQEGQQLTGDQRKALEEIDAGLQEGDESPVPTQELSGDDADVVAGLGKVREEAEGEQPVETPAPAAAVEGPEETPEASEFQVPAALPVPARRRKRQILSETALGPGKREKAAAPEEPIDRQTLTQTLKTFLDWAEEEGPVFFEGKKLSQKGRRVRETFKDWENTGTAAAELRKLLDLYLAETVDNFFSQGTQEIARAPLNKDLFGHTDFPFHFYPVQKVLRLIDRGSTWQVLEEIRTDTRGKAEEPIDERHVRQLQEIARQIRKTYPNETIAWAEAVVEEKVAVAPEELQGDQPEGDGPTKAEGPEEPAPETPEETKKLEDLTMMEIAGKLSELIKEANQEGGVQRSRGKDMAQKVWELWEEAESRPDKAALLDDETEVGLDCLIKALGEMPLKIKALRKARK